MGFLFFYAGSYHAICSIIKVTRKRNKVTLKKSKTFNKHTDLLLRKTKDFNVPVINAKHDNNGIMYYGREQDFDTVSNSIDIVQDGAASTGDVFYQKDATGVLSNAYLIKLKTINNVPTNCMLFLTSVLFKTIKTAFSYDNKATWSKVSKKVIKLPIDSNGDPDWQFMDSYIENVKQKARKKICAYVK